MREAFNEQGKSETSQITERIVILTEKIQQIRFEMSNLRELKRAYESENKKRALELIEELTKEYHKERTGYRKELAWENIKLSMLLNQDKKVKEIDWKERIRLIKSKVPIENVARTYVKLGTSDNKLTGRCPLCDAPEPSFVVQPVESSFTCSACLKNGDVFTFVMEVEKISFKDAVRILFSRYGNLFSSSR